MHFLFLFIFNFLKLLFNKFIINNFPLKLSPIFKISFITSTDCKQPIEPAKPPIIPDSSQFDILEESLLVSGKIHL